MLAKFLAELRNSHWQEVLSGTGTVHPAVLNLYQILGQFWCYKQTFMWSFWKNQHHLLLHAMVLDQLFHSDVFPLMSLDKSFTKLDTILPSVFFTSHLSNLVLSLLQTCELVVTMRPFFQGFFSVTKPSNGTGKRQSAKPKAHGNLLVTRDLHLWWLLF